MPANAIWTITYQAKVSETTPLESAINQAVAFSDEATSSPAQASVNIYKIVVPAQEVPTVVPLKINKQANLSTEKLEILFSIQ